MMSQWKIISEFETENWKKIAKVKEGEMREREVRDVRGREGVRETERKDSIFVFIYKGKRYIYNKDS